MRKMQMPKGNEYSIPDSELARLAINSNLTCDVRDPRNTRYLTPFSNAERESLADGMACAIYSAAADEFGDDTTQIEADQVFEQFLVDARRMLCDPDYSRLFGGDGTDCELGH
jgi:hypothetical protein